MESGVVKRIKTGIAGLDKMIAGGIPSGSQVLVLGGPGTGKTLMSIEIAYHNAKLEIPSTFITTEELRESILDNAENAFYAFEDFQDFIDRGLIQIIHLPVLDGFKARENFQKFIADDVIGALAKNKSKLLIFDSISSIRPVMEDDRMFTRSATYMTEAFREEEITSFITAEVGPEKILVNESGLFGTSMFDGLFKLSVNQLGGSAQYTIEISKLRNSAHRLSGVPYQITSSGFDVLAD